MRTLLCVVLAAAACGSNPSIDDFYKESVQLQCGFAVKCCGSISGNVVYASVAACESANDDSADLAMTKAAIAAGTQAYDSGAAGSCLDEIRSLYDGSCSAKVDSSAENKLLVCLGVVHGTVKVGATCDLDADFSPCEGDAACTQTSDGSTTGTCVAPAKSGADCSQTGDCVDGYYCDETTMTCLKLKSDGATCDDASECESQSCPQTTCTDLDEPVTDACQTTDVLETTRHRFSSRAPRALRKGSAR